ATILVLGMVALGAGLVRLAIDPPRDQPAIPDGMAVAAAFGFTAFLLTHIVIEAYIERVLVRKLIDGVAIETTVAMGVAAALAIGLHILGLVRRRPT